MIVNPPEGFIASANNRPQNGDADVGYFFSPDDRVRRMAALIEAAGTVDVDAGQGDAARRLRRLVGGAERGAGRASCGETGVAGPTRRARRGGCSS